MKQSKSPTLNELSLILVFIISITIVGNSQIDLPDGEILTYKGKKLFIGEDLTYVVKYAFFNLGEVRLKVVDKMKINNITVYKTVAYIDSYEDLPFVTLHQTYESYIDSTLFPLKFLAKIFGDDTVLVEYKFHPDHKVEMKKGLIDMSHIWLDTVKILNTQNQDGLSILYYARMNCGNELSESIPCFVNEKEEMTDINFYNESEPVSIDAVDYDVDCIRIDGETDFVSVYGLTGEFEGWFSNDQFSVPIRARMNVIIGSVNLELIKWNKKLWNPPVFKN